MSHFAGMSNLNIELMREASCVGAAVSSNIVINNWSVSSELHKITLQATTGSFASAPVIDIFNSSNFTFNPGVASTYYSTINNFYVGPITANVTNTRNFNTTIYEFDFSELGLVDANLIGQLHILVRSSGGQVLPAFRVKAFGMKKLNSMISPYDHTQFVPVVSSPGRSLGSMYRILKETGSVGVGTTYGLTSNFSFTDLTQQLGNNPWSMRNNISTSDPSKVTTSIVANNEVIYLGSTRPFKRFYIDVASDNQGVGTASFTLHILRSNGTFTGAGVTVYAGTSAGHATSNLINYSGTVIFVDNQQAWTRGKFTNDPMTIQEATIESTNSPHSYKPGYFLNPSLYWAKLTFFSVTNQVNLNGLYIMTDPDALNNQDARWS